MSHQNSREHLFDVCPQCCYAAARIIANELGKHSEALNQAYYDLNVGSHDSFDACFETCLAIRLHYRLVARRAAQKEKKSRYDKQYRADMKKWGHSLYWFRRQGGQEEWIIPLDKTLSKD